MQSNEFRVFVSSTFSDFKVERNALQRFVFPRLRDLAATHGIRFHPIDLRWSISEQAVRRQLAMEICARELRRCQDSGSMPCFMFMVGDRYGYRPVPNVISISDFKAIEKLITAAEARLLRHWYRLDENIATVSNPEGAFYLQSSDIEGDTKDSWGQEVEYSIGNILRDAANRLKIPERAKLNYSISATHMEILEGAIERPTRKDEAFGLIRNIADWDSFKNCEDIAKNSFMDVTTLGSLDIAARERLLYLKELLRESLPKDAIQETDINWNEAGLDYSFIGTLPNNLEECLPLLETSREPDFFCEFVWRKLGLSIRRAAEERKKKSLFTLEAQAHESQRKILTDVFVGRQALLTRFHQVQIEKNGRAVVVVGDEGSGKSALLAQYIEISNDAHGKGAVVIERFIGASTRSFNLFQFLSDLCAEISDAYKVSFQQPNDLDSLMRLFSNCLKLATAQHPLLIFIDGLERINQNTRPQFEWIPKLPPKFVLIVTSASSADSECLSAAKKRVSTESIWILPTLLDEEDGEGQAELAVDAMLRNVGRRLQPRQKRVVLDRFQQDKSPLYLRLVVEQVKHWRSFLDDTEESSEEDNLVPSNCEGLIISLINNLSASENHGTALTLRSLNYIALSKFGLAEEELLELLSNDRAVRDEFLSRSLHESPTEMLPQVIWSRLYHDLLPFLTMRRADNVDLFDFSQISFRAKATPNDMEATFLHVIMSKYFLEIGHPPDPEIHTKSTWNFKYPVPPRTVTELPHHSLQIAKIFPTTDGWNALAQILINCNFFLSAWEADRNEVKQCWTEIERNSPIRLLDVMRTTREAWNRVGYQHLAYLVRDLGYAEDALRLQKNLLKITDAGSHFATTLKGDYGNMLMQQGRYEEAMGIFEQVVEFCKEYSDHLALASAIQSQGIIMRRWGRFSEACALFDESDRIANQLRKSPDSAKDAIQIIANNAGNRGNAFFELQEFDQALKEHAQQESLCESIGDSKGVATALGNQAATLIGQVQEGLRSDAVLDEALEMLQRQHKLAERIQDKENIHRALGNMAAVSMLRFRWPEAAKYIQQDIEICRESGYRVDLGKALTNAITIYRAMNDYEKAEEMRTTLSNLKS